MKHSLNKGTTKESILSNLSEQQDLENKQDTLVSGTNIKTINGESILGSGDIEIQGGGAYVEDKTLYLNAVGSGSTGGGVSNVFEDIDALPTENINSDVIYRLFRVYGIYNSILQDNTTVHIVNSLPTTGENCTVDGSEFTVMYYNKSDDNVYGYVGAAIGAAFGVPVGWYPASSLLQIAEFTYGGIVDSAIGLENSTYYFVREYDFYIYKGKWMKLYNDLVLQGDGKSSIITNDLRNVASGDYSHAEGYKTTASGDFSHAEGDRTESSGESSHAEGFNTTASNTSSHAEGATTTASGIASHAEGAITTASGDFSHAGGHSTKASGMYAHAEGYNTTASGEDSHAEGNGTVASNYDCHAEGYATEASGSTAHAEGCNTVASGDNSHAEGYKTVSSGDDSHAEGYDTKALGTCAHAEGYSTIASSNASHAEGKFNIEDTNKKYAHIVGNGSSNTARSNAHTLDWDGNAWFKGKVRVGGTSWDDATELGGGGGSQVVDVFELPENPDPHTIYRLTSYGLFRKWPGEGEDMGFDNIITNLIELGINAKIVGVSSLPTTPEESSTSNLIVYICSNEIGTYYGGTWYLNDNFALILSQTGLDCTYGGFVDLTNTEYVDKGLYVYTYVDYYIGNMKIDSDLDESDLIYSQTITTEIDETRTLNFTGRVNLQAPRKISVRLYYASNDNAYIGFATPNSFPNTYYYLYGFSRNGELIQFEKGVTGISVIHKELHFAPDTYTLKIYAR